MDLPSNDRITVINVEPLPPDGNVSDELVLDDVSGQYPFSCYLNNLYANQTASDNVEQPFYSPLVEEVSHKPLASSHVAHLAPS